MYLLSLSHSEVVADLQMRLVDSMTTGQFNLEYGYYPYEIYTWYSDEFQYPAQENLVSKH